MWSLEERERERDSRSVCSGRMLIGTSDVWLQKKKKNQNVVKGKRSTRQHVPPAWSTKLVTSEAQSKRIHIIGSNTESDRSNYDPYLSLLACMSRTDNRKASMSIRSSTCCMSPSSPGTLRPSTCPHRDCKQRSRKGGHTRVG